MNYQVMYSRDRGYENVYPDGYGMHEEGHGGATFENVLDGCAHIRSGQGAIRVVENNDEHSEFCYAVLNYPNPWDSQTVTVGDFKTREEVESFLGEKYDEARCEFDDDYNCDGCWLPETGDPDVWFNAVQENGAIAARCGTDTRILDPDEYFDYVDLDTEKDETEVSVFANSGADDILIDSSCTVADARKMMEKEEEHFGERFDQISYFFLPVADLDDYLSCHSVVPGEWVAEEEARADEEAHDE